MKNGHQFQYTRSNKIIHWGCSFDSLTELKYAISIADEYAFLRERVSIYYHPGTLQPTDYIRDCHRRYTPDFLIRHRQTGKAFLVEIKPAAFRNHPQLLLRKTVAENYIRWKKYDWEFRVVFDDEILLDAEQLDEFLACSKLKSKCAFLLWFEQYNRKFDRSAPNMFSHVPTETDIRFVMFGNKSGKKVK